MRAALLAVVSVCCTAAAPLAEPVELDTFVAAARDADIVVLGEVHDNPAHHRNQAAIVAALQPAALVFEMIPQAEEDAVNALREAGASRDEIAAELDWKASGWPEFGHYAAILEAAPAAQIFGAGQPLADVQRAAVEGAAGAFGPDAATYGLDEALDPGEQAKREAMQARAHCDALPRETLPGMVEAQRFRDAGLADAALWARTMTGDGQVVVITGSGHADRRRGMPALVAVAAPDLRVVSLGQLEQEPAEPEAFDAYLLAPPPGRDHPCAALLPPEE